MADIIKSIRPLFENLNNLEPSIYDYSLFEEFHSFGQSYFLQYILDDLKSKLCKFVNKNNLQNCIIALNDVSKLDRIPSNITVIPVQWNEFKNIDIRNSKHIFDKTIVNWIKDLTINGYIIAAADKLSYLNILNVLSTKSAGSSVVEPSNYYTDVSTGKTEYKVEISISHLGIIIPKREIIDLPVIAETLYHEIMHAYTLYSQLDNNYISSENKIILDLILKDKIEIKDLDSSEIKNLLKCFYFLSESELSAYISEIVGKINFADIRTREEFYNVLNNDSHFSTITNCYNMARKYLKSFTDHIITYTIPDKFGNPIIYQSKLSDFIISIVQSIYGNSHNTLSNIERLLRKRYGEYKMKFYDTAYYGLDESIQIDIIKYDSQFRGYVS